MRGKGKRGEGRERGRKEGGQGTGKVERRERGGGEEGDRGEGRGRGREGDVASTVCQMRYDYCYSHSMQSLS